MEELNLHPKSHRREFLSAFAASAAALSFGSLVSNEAQAGNNNAYADVDEWFNKIKGKHKIVFDVTEPHGVFPFAWPKVFLLTNANTGTAEKDCSVVVVLRHLAIPYAMQSSLWEKYNFGEFFKVEDPATKTPSKRNAFWQPKPGDFKIPGLGAVAIGINELQASGVMFCVCDMALTVNSTKVADGMKADAAEVKKEWVAGLLPGIQVVPSGVLALGRAQEKGCGYIFAS